MRNRLKKSGLPGSAAGLGFALGADHKYGFHPAWVNPELHCSR